MILFLDSVGRFFSKMFVSTSAQADDINRLFIIFMAIAAVILAIVIFMVIGGAIRYRSGKNPGIPRQISGNKGLELTWTIIPFIIVIVLFFMSLRAMKQIDEPVKEGHKPDIVIIAHQWWWEMRYPGHDVVTANELHIPVGKKLLMHIKSADVIHSWWVPALGRKIDAIPGRTNKGWIESDSAGVFQGTCSEFCGMEHAWMRISVIAESESDYEQWLSEEQKPFTPPEDSLAIVGAHMFQQMTCGNCHTIKGTASSAKIGPDLTHVAARQTLLSGMLENNPENIKKWLTNPQKVKEGANMPNMLLSKQEVNAISEFLDHLK